MSGGHGPGGYPGPGYGAPDFDDDAGRTRPRRPGAPRAGYQGPGYGAQDFSARPHDGQAHGGSAGPGYQPQGYDQPVQRGTGPRRADGGYSHGGYGQRPDRGYDQGAYDQRAYNQGAYNQGAYNQGAYNQGGYNQGGYEDQRDEEFLPGFGGRGGYDGGPGRGRDDRYDYGDGYGPGNDTRRGPRGGGPADRGPGQRGPDDQRDDWDDRNVRPRKKATRWLPRILVLTVVGVIVIGGLVGGLWIKGKYDARYHPADYAGQGTGEVTVQVKSGDNAFTLAPRLLQAGVIASTRAFTNAASNSTNTAGLEAGYFQVHSHMQASLAYAALLNPKNRVQTVVTIVEGKRAVDIIAILAKDTKIPLKDFQQVLANPAQLGLPSYANGKAEGYLFPATYAIVPHETALQILQAMVQRFNEEAQAVDLVNAAKTAGLTPTQLVIEASLAQAEGGSVSDYPKIAEVINNRLRIGMHLQFDSTVLYGIGQYRVSATIKETKTPGPYNTYLNAGLPPGPISNPGDAAIKGVLNADHGNWLYFLTVPNGKSQFSATPLKGQ